MRKNRKPFPKSIIFLVLFVGLLILLFALPFSPGRLVRLNLERPNPVNYFDITKDSVTSVNYFARSSKKSVTFVSSTWCGPCDYLADEIKKVAADFPELNFYKVDIDTSREFANEVGVILPEALVFIDKDNFKKFDNLDLVSLNVKLNTFIDIGAYAL